MMLQGLYVLSKVLENTGQGILLFFFLLFFLILSFMHLLSVCTGP